jgi:hypothetical protein
VRFGLLISVVAVGALAQITTAEPSAKSPTGRRVPCGEAIAITKFPYVGDRRQPYRLVLGVVSAPPAYMGQVNRQTIRAWPYWRKQGIVVRNSGDTVEIGVPRAWRSRAAIAWGYGGNGEPFRSVTLVGCGSDRTRGRAYSGGFYPRSRSACVPLTFRVGKRTRTMRFDLGRRCEH